MTESVYHTGYDIVLNLSLDDLGHPGRPELWDEIYRPRHFRHGLLRCPARENGVVCREAMYVQVRNGRRIACHVNAAIGPHAPDDGSRRAALRERIAVSAQGTGYEVVVDEDAADCPDVLVKGQGGRAIGWEVQLGRTTAGSVRERTRRATERGVTPMWTVDDRRSEAIDRAPWTRLDRVTDWRQIAGRHLNVRGGVRELRMERCDERRATPCPERRRGRCGGWHACWDLARGVYLDDLIARTAGGEYVPLLLPSKKRPGGNHMWVTTKDKTDFLQDRREPYAWDADLDDAVRGGLGGRARRDGGERIDAGEWLSASAETGPGLIHVADRYVPPQDLVDLRNAFVEADEQCAAVADEMPSGLAVARGTAVVEAELQARADRLRARRLAIVGEMYRHPWWATVDDRNAAQQELRKVARDQAL